MKKALLLAALACVFAAGCSQTSDPTGGGIDPPGPPMGVGAGGPGGEVEPAPLAIASGEVKISADNSAIGFVGSKPDGSSHAGGFKTFTGTLKVNEQSKALEGVQVEIDTTSLWADAGGGSAKLTTHLKSPDFFDVEQFPKASFKSTSVTAKEGAEGEYTVKGDLTLHGTTKPIEFPATVTITDAGLTLKSEFTFDRTTYGIDYQPDKVKKDVSVTVNVGQRVRPGGRGGRGGRGGGGGRRDPRAMFEQRDADKDGKLSGEEIPRFLQGRMDEIDKDKDGAISLEELQNAPRGGPGGGGPGGRPGGGGPGGRPGGGGPGGAGRAEGRPRPPGG